MEKSDFWSYKTLALETQQLREQLATLESSLYSPKGQRFTSTPRVPSGGGSTMDGAVARHMKLVDLYRGKLAEQEAQLLKIEGAVMSLSDTAERAVMRERYILGQRWPTVVTKLQKLGYSERQVYRLHGSALTKLKEV